MARTVQFYRDRVSEALNNGFNSKASQKRALVDLSYAYEICRENLSNLINVKDQTEEQHNAYWSIPFELHQWRNKHAEIMRNVAPGEICETVIEQIELLIVLRNTIKLTPIIKIESKSAEMKREVERIQEGIIKKMERLGKVYDNCLNLLDLFKGLPVTANVHIVTNQYGTIFPRVFYFLDGKLTPLNLIIAAYQEHQRKNK
ncbi:TPA: hypothetical protein I8Y16_004038 [Raoultella ornithinolytica]|nr:hypothetical protein [Raoultella ornithinolytica]HAT1670183.1 hypothetical protein [Raoultella ornithinolytica]